MKVLNIFILLFITLSFGYSVEDDYETDDYEDTLWDVMKEKTNALLERTKQIPKAVKGVLPKLKIPFVRAPVSTEKVSNNINNATQVSNVTQVTNTIKPSNVTEIKTQVDDKFERLVNSIIKSYEDMAKKMVEQISKKKIKMTEVIANRTKEITVLKTQIIDLDSEIKEKIHEIEVSQESINKQETSIKVYQNQLANNAKEKDARLRESVDADLRKTIAAAINQKKQSEKEQTKMIKQLRKLYREKKAVEKSIKDKVEGNRHLNHKINTIVETTTKKADEMNKVVAWMKAKLVSREELIKKLVDVKKSINDTEAMVNSIITLPTKKQELQETLVQLKKVRLNVIREIKNIRTLLNARISVYNKVKIVRLAYQTRKQHLGDEEKRLTQRANKIRKNIHKLNKEIKEKQATMKKQTVQVLKDIQANEVSEMKGKLNKFNAALRKVEREISFVKKQLTKAKKELNNDLLTIKKQFEKNKIRAFKNEKKIAVMEKKRLEKRIERLERAMTNKKYTEYQIKEFASKAEMFRKKLPQAILNIDNAEKRLGEEYNKIREIKMKKFQEVKKLAAELKQKEDDLESEVSVMKEKIAQTLNKLEKSGMIEDLNDLQRRYASVQSKYQVAKNQVSRVEKEIIEQLKADDYAEIKMISVLKKNKKRMMKRIQVLRDHPEYSNVVEELQHSVDQATQDIDKHEKKENELTNQINEAVKRRNEELKMSITEVKAKISKLRTEKEDISDRINRILKSSKTDSVQELKKSKAEMLKLKKQLLRLNKEERKQGSILDGFNKIVFIRSLDDKTTKAAIKSRELIRKMKKSSRKVRALRTKLSKNKHLIDKLYKSVHETGDMLGERADERMEQLKNIRTMLKNKLRKIMYEHKKLQNSLMKHVERVKRLARYRIHNYEKQHSQLLNQRNALMRNKQQIKRDKGTEYFYTNLDILDEKMNDVLRSEAVYKRRLNQRLNKMVAIAKECEKKTPEGLEGIKMKCTLCRNLSSYLLKKLRRDKLTPKQVMKSLYAKCESSKYPAQCLRTALKLSTKAFLPENVDLTPKELCYTVGRCVLRV